jgi:CRISPR/Cas system CMR-associated protein Cmr5 small subunit
MSKKPKNQIEGPGASDTIDFSDAILGNIDNDLVESLKEKLENKKKEIRSKVYAISCDSSVFSLWKDYILNNAEWNSTEALGIIELEKQIVKIEKEGIKDDTIYLTALHLEASHYFISKSKGSGIDNARKFISLYKPFDQALNDAKKDAMEVKDIEKELNAAMQGIQVS